MANTNPMGMLRAARRATAAALAELAPRAGATAMRAQVLLALTDERNMDPATTPVCVARDEMILTGTVTDLRALQRALETGSEIALEHVVLAPLRAPATGARP